MAEIDRDAEAIYKIYRASHGLNPIDDTLQGLINPKDKRERTNLDIRGVYAQNYKRALFLYGGDEWEIMDYWADGEDTYRMSLDGEAKKLAVMMAIGRKQDMTAGNQVSINIPDVQTKPQPQQPPQQEPKKGWLHR